MQKLVITALVALGMVAGCAVHAERDDETAAATSSELTLSGVQHVGKLKNGETRKFPWVPSALRSYEIDAKGGDQITFDVKSTNGLPIAYITDANLQVLAASEGPVSGPDAGPFPDSPPDGPVVVPGNDRGDGSHSDLGNGGDSEGDGDGDVTPTDEEAERAGAPSVSVKFKIPNSAPLAKYKLVFKNKDFREVLFNLKVAVLTGAPVCSYQGSSYGVGSTYAAKDECNTCNCKADGTSQCTTFTCVCGNEPWRSYEFTSQDKCLGWHPSCPSGAFPFANSCGCGCERPH